MSPLLGSLTVPSAPCTLRALPWGHGDTGGLGGRNSWGGTSWGEGLGGQDLLGVGPGAGSALVSDSED